MIVPNVDTGSERLKVASHGLIRFAWNEVYLEVRRPAEFDPQNTSVFSVAAVQH
jgi:hypothetical protein